MFCLSDEFDVSLFPCNLMENFKNREMFRNRNNIDHLMKVRGTTIKAKRKIIMTANTPLFYIFGYDIKDKPWLTYEERYGIK
jgi:hypothetical protein